MYFLIVFLNIAANVDALVKTLRGEHFKDKVREHQVLSYDGVKVRNWI